jgi:mannose-1-phosphate guanylyltransferase/mannose-6-phosphate isomerase
MTEPIIPLVLCGGAGTRLWPASREGRPKQFLRLFGPYSTFQDTIKRVSDRTAFGRPIVITNTQSRFLVLEQLEEIGVEADILLEPVRRDSGPAIAAATLFAQRERRDPIVFTLAADHVVSDPAGFAAACGSARTVADAGRIVTFGIRPDRPATEYGYIRPGDPVGDGVFAVRQFVEKPDEATARRYVDEGFLWNSGNFMFRASVFLSEYRDFEPDSAAAVSAAVEGAGQDLGFVTLAAAGFESATAKSVDYAVMERTSLAAVIPVSFGWSDVGSWDAVWALKSKDPDGNASQGSVVFVDSRQSLVSSEKALVALLGVDDLAVVASSDAILVARRSDGPAMKALVSRLRDVAPAITEEHVVVHRPWGSYQSLEVGNRYQVKRLIVKAGKRLSLQLHHHRAEHWVVVRGAARVTVGDEIKILHENESTYIPLGAVHRLENPGKIDLEVIEIQTGTYLGEDDIERIEDDFRRA